MSAVGPLILGCMVGLAAGIVIGAGVNCPVALWLAILIFSAGMAVTYVIDEAFERLLKWALPNAWANTEENKSPLSETSRAPGDHGA